MNFLNNGMKKPFGFIYESFLYSRLGFYAFFYFLSIKSVDSACVVLLCCGSTQIKQLVLSLECACLDKLFGNEFWNAVEVNDGMQYSR